MNRYVANLGSIKIFEVAIGRRGKRTEKGKSIDAWILMIGLLVKIVAAEPISS